MSLSFDQNCFHFTFELQLSNESYFHKYEKLPSTNIITEKCVAHNFGFVYGSMHYNAETVLKLASIDTFSWLSVLVVTHRAANQRNWIQFPGETKTKVCFLFFCCWVFTFLVPKPLFVLKCFNNFCSVILFSILNILQSL